MASGMQTDEVLALVQDVSTQVVEPRFRSLDDGEVHEKNPGDLVTVADREAEVLLTRALTAAYPDALVLGEEAASADPHLLERFAGADHAFTVDPVDGTRNFVHGSPDHAVMVSELRAGAVVRSWIWQPQHRLAYVAERGAGAYRDGERLTTTPPAEGAPLRGTTSNRAWVGRSLGDLPAMGLTWVSCGVDYPRLAEGHADYIVYRGVSPQGTSRRGLPWDHAPGSLLVTEAGGAVLTFAGDPYDPRRLPLGGLVVAPDRATAELVRGLVHTL